MVENSFSLRENQQLKGGKYTIRKQLGQGGFGITYLATTPAVVKGDLGEMTVEAKVVVKEFFMKEECERASDGRTLTVVSAGKTEMVERYREKFRQEALLLRKMRHPNIVKVVDIIEDENNTVYYVMSYLSGGTLRQLVSPSGTTKSYPLSQERALKYIRQVANALGIMHSRRMCHFDVKPDNIMLDEHDNAILIDFGLAKNYRRDGHQMTSLLIGASPGYAPLEQIQADLEDFKPLADIYALGATLYFLLTGHTPQPADIHLEKVLPEGQCNIPDYLWNAICQSMQADYGKRPQDVNAFLKLLEEPQPMAVAQRVVDNSTVPISPKPKPNPVKLTKSVIIAGSLVVMAFFAWGLVSVIHSFDGSTEEHTDSINRVMAEKETLVVLRVSNMEVNDSNGKMLYTYSGEVDEKGTEGQTPSQSCKPEGMGVAIYPSDDEQKRSTYEGGFKHGLRHGQGTLKYQNGDTFTGSFASDHLKEGKYISNDGSYFQGEFQNDKPFKGAWYNADGSLYVEVSNGGM